jgi:hypothetical protein
MNVSVTPKDTLRTLLICLAVLAVGLAIGAALPRAAHASRIHECGDGPGGAYMNITSRKVGCRKTRRVARSIDHHLPRRCLNNGTKPRCVFRVGRWVVRGHWFVDQYGADQQDLRATARHGRVVRFQTDWDDA